MSPLGTRRQLMRTAKQRLVMDKGFQFGQDLSDDSAAHDWHVGVQQAERDEQRNIALVEAGVQSVRGGCYLGMDMLDQAEEAFEVDLVMSKQNKDKAGAARATGNLAAVKAKRTKRLVEKAAEPALC